MYIASSAHTLARPRTRASAGNLRRPRSRRLARAPAEGSVQHELGYTKAVGIDPCNRDQSTQ
eukprot:7369745-Heterocapsa_arctica.AAC.1